MLREYYLDKKPMAFIHVYGCQQNVSDGETIKGILQSMGYGFTDKKENADLILFNTCAVREHAEDRVFGNVGALKNLKKKNSKLIVALCGCMMEQEHVVNQIKSSFPFVDLLFGTSSIHRLPEMLTSIMNNRKAIYEYGIRDDVIVEGLPIKRDDTLKAYVPIMYGCDNFCSYCIVPYVRGRERSRLMSNIMKDVNSLIESGYKDITLLGQNVNSYGKGLNGEVDFPMLLKGISNISGDFWIRFMTSHPKDATCALIDTIAEQDKLCNHIHLPFQSGSNNILKQMNRKYTREDYLDIVNYAKMKIPNVSITSDVIVGFPGETYEDFKATLSLVEQVKFTSLFTFIYSKRPKTRAATMLDPVTYEEKLKWFNELLALQRRISNQYCESMIGRDVRVLIEKESAAQGHLTARTEGNVIVDLIGSRENIGSFAYVRVIGYNNWVLKAQLLKGDVVQ